MDKKIYIISVITVFFLLVISFASAINSDTLEPIRKESPLFRIRIKRVVREKVENFVTRFIGERVFFLPFQLFWDMDDFPLKYYFRVKDTVYDWTCPNHWTCESTILCECTINCNQ